MANTLDFSKIREAPETNKLSLENENILLQRPELKVLADMQYYSAARAIEMIDMFRSKIRDIKNPNTIKEIKKRILAYAPLTSDEKERAYSDYLDEMDRLGLSPVLDKEVFLFYRDYANIDGIIPDVLERMGLETSLTEDFTED